jgi:hypothetical protein
MDVIRLRVYILSRGDEGGERDFFTFGGAPLCSDNIATALIKHHKEIQIVSVNEKVHTYVVLCIN